MKACIRTCTKTDACLCASRRYKTIYICGSFGLGGSREKDLETLRRCYAHLEDGGALLLDIQAEYMSAAAWNLWLPEQRQALPQPWPEKGGGRIASDAETAFRSISDRQC